MPLPSKEKLNKTLHGTRGLAAFIVVLSHIGAGGITESYFSEITPFLGTLKNILIIGQYGVEIFFMISGYLITASIIRHPTVLSFITDRCIRLYPVFLPAVLLIFIAGPIANYAYFDGFTGIEWFQHLIINLLFIPGVAPMEAALVVAWSLSYEAVFYLAVSYLKFFKDSKVAKIAFLLLFALPFLLSFPRALFFVVGVIIYFLGQRTETFNIRAPQLFLPLLILLLIILYAIQEHYASRELISSWSVLPFWIVSLALGYFVFVEIALEAPIARSILAGSWMQFLGSISYSLYIWHTMIMFGTKRYFATTIDTFGSYGSFMLFAVSSIVLSLIFSYVSYVFLEVKVVRLLKGWTKKRRYQLAEETGIE